MRVLVLGASGMAGHVVSLYLKEAGCDVETLSAQTLLDKDTKLIDVQDINQLKKMLASNQYDIVVNCIGVLVKQSEERQDTAIYINSFLPKFLETYYKDSGTRIIHISTNGVFSGNHPPYSESSSYDCEDFYGRTKALGELINNKDLTIRSSIIGPELSKGGKSLFDWFYKQKGEVSGFTLSIWKGVTTLELAKFIKQAIDQNINGVYHLVPETSISKYDLLVLLSHIFNKETEIKAIDGSLQDMNLISTRKDFKYTVPSYEAMVKDMKVWMHDHKEIYGHYAG